MLKLATAEASVLVGTYYSVNDYDVYERYRKQPLCQLSKTEVLSLKFLILLPSYLYIIHDSENEAFSRAIISRPCDAFYKKIEAFSRAIKSRPGDAFYKKMRRFRVRSLVVDFVKRFYKNVNFVLF